MRAWQFSRPKGPGFGIARNFYMTVLSSKPTMPAILEIINPRGEGGAVEGFGAPLANKPKETLAQPMERGAYAIASKDRKTVVKMLVLSKEEAGFDPEPFVRSALAQQLDPELVTRVRATWQLAQLTFESHDPEVYPAIDFLLDFSTRLALLTDGVVADPVSQRYLLPHEVRQPVRAGDKVDARELVSVVHRQRPDGLHFFTLGLQKFGLPELEINGLTMANENQAQAMLMSLAQTVLTGKKIESGDRFGARGYEFEAREGGFDRGLWEGIEVLELLPPTQYTAVDSLEAWATSVR